MTQAVIWSGYMAGAKGLLSVYIILVYKDHESECFEWSNLLVYMNIWPFCLSSSSECSKVSSIQFTSIETYIVLSVCIHTSKLQWVRLISKMTGHNWWICFKCFKELLTHVLFFVFKWASVNCNPPPQLSDTLPYTTFLQVIGHRALQNIFSFFFHCFYRVMNLNFWNYVLNAPSNERFCPAG